MMKDMERNRKHKESTVLKKEQVYKTKSNTIPK